MKTASTPIEIWYSEPNLRSILRNNKIVYEKDGVITIPTFRCNIEKPGEGRNTKNEIRLYAFYHQKLQFMLDAMHGDYVRALETFSNNHSFICGKNLEITVTLL